MKYAKSMYFGGDIIAAEECDFNSSRELGLKCPFCDSAVFIRSQSIRQIKGREQLVDTYFAHYPSGAPENWDCEKRTHTKQGRETIERIKIEARNQRLQLYNAHLWTMFAEGHGISHRELNKVRSLFGEAWCERQSILIRYEWNKTISDVYKYIDAAVQDIRQRADKDHYLLSCDIRLHETICHEIAEFLGTNSGGFAFHKLFKFSLWQQLELKQSGWGVQQLKQLSPIAHISSMAIALVATPWIDQIQQTT